MSAALDASVFSSPSFSSSAWIKEQRARGADLRALRGELGRHHRALNEEVGKLMQGELPRLVQLTKELSTGEEELRGLCKQVVGFQEGSRAVTAEFAARLERFSAVLDERRALEVQREQLQLVRRLAEALDVVERLLDAAPTDATLDCFEEPGEGTPRPLLALLADAEALLRAAGALGRARQLARQGAELPLVRASAARLDRARARLVPRLQDCLGVSLEAGCAAPVRDCLRGFVEAGCVDEAYAWVRSEWVAPRLLPALHEAARDTRERALPALVGATLAFARGDAFAPLLQPELAAARPPLHLLTHALWAELVGFLTKTTPQFFGAGIPDAFQLSFVSLSALRRELEALLPTAAARAYLRAHPATAEFTRRFNLPIYFQLRVQEIQKALDAALPPRGAPLPAAPPAGRDEGDAAGGGAPPPPPLSTEAALAFVHALRRCFAPTVFLPPLAARFLRLALQCAARFTAWARSLAPAEAAAPAAATPAPAAGGAPPAAGGAPPAAPAAADAEPPPAYFDLYFDLGGCGAWLRALAPRLPALLGLPPAAGGAADGGAADGGAADGRAADGRAAALGGECAALLLEAAGALDDAGALLRAALVARLAEQCAAPLTTGVRAIAASYRMTGKGVPTAPSFFVPEVLRPLRALLDEHAPRLAAAPRAAWVRDVAAAVAALYLGLASTSLDTVRKNEEALRRLRGGAAQPGAPGAPPAAAAPLSDAHKICVQLCLDVAAFGEQERRRLPAPALAQRTPPITHSQPLAIFTRKQTHTHACARARARTS